MEIPGARCIDWLEWRKDQGIKWSGISFLKDWFNVAPLDKSLNNKLVVQKALKVCMIASTFWFGLSTITYLIFLYTQPEYRIHKADPKSIIFSWYFYIK